MRKICVATGGRSDYGLLYWLMKEIQSDSELKLQVVVTGMHLMPEFGNTFRTIEQDGFQISAKIVTDLKGDSAEAITKSIGTAIIGFGKAFNVLKPDVLVVLGDRFEIFSACVAATPLQIPIAHVHGGETSQGAFDESFRHAMTKMTHYHFVATEDARRRVIQLGEQPDRVFRVGAPGLDQLDKLKLMSRETFLQAVGLDSSKPFFLVTFHPVTLEANTAGSQFKELLEALEQFHEIQTIFTTSNSDTSYQSINGLLDQYISQHQRTSKAFQMMGSLKYLSALAYADAVIGNSSSALIEAPTFKVPAINIGDRQKGRIKGANVICCEPRKDRIVQAIQKGIDPEFRNSLKDSKNPYGEGGASKRIKDHLKRISLNSEILKKEFYDAPNIESSFVKSH